MLNYFELVQWRRPVSVGYLANGGC